MKLPRKAIATSNHLVGGISVRVVGPYNGSLLAIIARDGKITYDALKEKYCVPTPPGVISSKNAMFDSDLKLLEAEGYIERTGDLIMYIGR